MSRSKPLMFPLHSAAENGDLESALRLIQEGAPVDQQDAEGLVPLLCAAKKGHTLLVKLLLTSGASPQAKSPLTNQSALWKAAIFGDLPTVRVLLEHGAGVDTQDIHGFTPLLVASQEGHTEVVKELLQANARTHLPNNQGSTPIHMAAVRNRTEVVVELLKHGVSPNQVSHTIHI